MFNMIGEILNLIIKKLEERNQKEYTMDNKVVKTIEELNKLEVEYAEAMADVERWGDINDDSDWRTVKVNKLKRIIQAKEKMIKSLKN